MKNNEVLQVEGPAGTAIPGQTSPARRVLVVDDDDSIRRFDAEVLVQSGYKVDTAADGAAAWQALNATNHDLLLTDNDMPKVSGLELLKKVHAAHLGLPVIMASGTMPTQELARCPWLQPAALLLKPYTIEELLGTVKEVLSPAGRARHPITAPADPQSGRSTVPVRRT